MAVVSVTLWMCPQLLAPWYNSPSKAKPSVSVFGDGSPLGPDTTRVSGETTPSSLNSLLAPTSTYRNFALLSSGAMVIPQLTTATSNLPPLTNPIKAFYVWATGYDDGDPFINLPTVTIEGGVQEVHDCWQFDGEHGHLAVRLSNFIYITDVSIYHPISNLLSSSEVLQAPRNMSLWGLTSVPTATAAQQSIPEVALQESRHIRKFATKAHLPQYTDELDQFVLLGSFQYNSTVGGHQHFSISSTMHNGWMGFNVVILEVTSNAGSDSTCIYHIEVHGYEV